jgi:hypothetical protein
MLIDMNKASSKTQSDSTKMCFFVSIPSLFYGILTKWNFWFALEGHNYIAKRYIQ